MVAKPDADTFIGHLEALRSTLIRCAIAVGVLLVPAYLLAPYCIQWLVWWTCPPEVGPLRYFSPMEVFLVQLKLALVMALLVSFPYCIWQIWRFLLPALYESERQALVWWVLASSVLFFLGGAFCVAFILPLVMRFSSEFANPYLTPLIGLSPFLELAGTMIVVTGLVFQFPLAVLLGVRFGLVSTAFLREKRRYVIVAILIIAGIVTPPDVFSQVMVAIPAWILFEVGLLFAIRYEKRLALLDEEEESAAAADVPADAMPASVPAGQDVGSMDDGMLEFYEREARRTHREP
ncbi:MAG: twin-arginine translocase subunit TatC [Burkholderiaceae bacterium]|jgi:sec-independent protein translocase protein TatC|nr:twin-arginine translocase subunit TatC [Burkholderiaceae bacterium]